MQDQLNHYLGKHLLKHVSNVITPWNIVAWQKVYTRVEIIQYKQNLRANYFHGHSLYTKCNTTNKFHDNIISNEYQKCGKICWAKHLCFQPYEVLCHLNIYIYTRDETILQYIDILQYLFLQYNTIWLKGNINILHIAIYCDILQYIAMFVVLML